ncbi:TIGR02444 family protein [Pseudomonas sp. CFBP 13719]|uniref:TIGR02444 family protein n=1 Tax=Pseudomonas sp. CFBP 13719 TaxID=2775303 RepID=UPI00178727CA|nr:TIGR02444 family protein [Pseudomonas sp. CFBP 13719]MBD8684187.1 TIGR02444 family protein [Pseudomonas sp. CFBP 13719]
MHDELWEFALDLYARPGVEDACLQLQANGANVCLLLCGAWLEARGVACTCERVTLLEAIARPWHEDVVRPLRELRQQWRAQAVQDPELMHLRESVKALELNAERQLLQRLHDQAAPWPLATQCLSMTWLPALLPATAAHSSAALQVLGMAARQTQASLEDAPPLSS